MKSIHRSFFIKFLLAAFLCGQLFVGASQAVAGETLSALDEARGLFVGDSTDTGFDGFTLGVRYLGLVEPELQVHVFFNVHLNDARLLRPEAASSQHATGPPTDKY